MRFSRMTLSYVKHNFLKSMGLMLIPTVLLGILINPLNIVEIIVSVGKKEETYNSFLDIYRKINGYTGPWRFSFLVISVIVSIIFLSLLSGYVRQKMRYGLDSRGRWSMIGSHLNDNFIPVLKYLLMLFVSLEILAILLSTFLYTTIKIFKNALPVCLILAFVFLMLEVLFMSMSLLTVPNMTMKGFGLFKAFGHSVYSLSAKTFKVFGSILWIMLIMSVPMVFLILFPFNGAKYLIALVSFLFYWMVASYIGVLVYVVYFDVEELEREDLKL